MDSSSGSEVRNSPVVGSIPRRSPGEGHGNPLQYSCLENPMDGVGHDLEAKQQQQGGSSSRGRSQISLQEGGFLREVLDVGIFIPQR